jgi:hypothetical protein
LYQEVDFVTTTKALRLKWLGHVNRMEDHRRPKRVLQDIPWGGSRRGNPRKRWLDDVANDLRKIGVKLWRIEAMDRTEQKKKYVRRPRFFKSCRAME